MTPNIEPLPGRLVVELEKPPERQGGVFLPATLKPTGWETARVVAVHEDEKRIKPGDRVLIPHGTGMVTLQGSDVIGVHREDIAGILED